MIIGEKRIREILKKPALKDGLQSYRFIMERLHQTDVSADREFQSAFRSFYQMRRFYSDAFAERYFMLMEQMKNSRNMSFVTTLERVKHIRDTYEMSFSSKMTHTIDPLHPIWDSVVTKKHFGISAPHAKKNREEACVFSGIGDHGCKENRFCALAGPVTGIERKAPYAGRLR